MNIFYNRFLEEFDLRGVEIKTISISDIDSSKVHLDKLDLSKIYYRVDDREFSENDIIESEENPRKNFFRTEGLYANPASRWRPKKYEGLLAFDVPLPAYYLRRLYKVHKTKHCNPYGYVNLYAVALPKDSSPIYRGEGEQVRVYHIIENLRPKKFELLRPKIKTNTFLHCCSTTEYLLDKAVVVKVLELERDT